MNRENIKDLTWCELKNKLAEESQPPFRATQIFFWIYKKGICDFKKMSNIPGRLRAIIKEKFFISALECSGRLKSEEGTEKFIFKLKDGRYIETVSISAKNRKTLCLSTQVGCKFRCAFCASGMRGFIRNLKPSEIVGQVLYAQHILNYKLTNFVFMGMGEPLDNWDNVINAIKIMIEPKGMGIGAGRITISTSGIIPGINRLAELKLPLNLSVSLHAGNEKLRNELMPLNKKYPLSGLISACRNYTKTTGRIVTLEYILINNKNSSLSDADELAGIAKKINAKVNLIKCSFIPGLGFMPPQQKDIEAFKKRLLSRKVNTILRQSKGGNIRASCGQLENRDRHYLNYFE